MMSSEIVSNGSPIDGFQLFMDDVVACNRVSFFRSATSGRFMGSGEGVRKESTAGKKRMAGSSIPGDQKKRRERSEKYGRQYYER